MKSNEPIHVNYSQEDAAREITRRLQGALVLPAKVKTGFHDKPWMRIEQIGITSSGEINGAFHGHKHHKIALPVVFPEKTDIFTNMDGNATEEKWWTSAETKKVFAKIKVALSDAVAASPRRVVFFE